MGKISLSNIVEELAVRNGLSREAADNFMRAFVEAIEKGLQEDNLVKIKGLGTFKLQELNSRASVDVNTGERITIKGYRRVAFTPDSAMKEFVNRPFAHFEPTELNEGYPIDGELNEKEDLSDENDVNEFGEEENIVESTVQHVAEEVTIENSEDVAEEVAEESLVEELVVVPTITEVAVTEMTDVKVEETEVIVTNEIVSEKTEEENTEEITEEIHTDTPSEQSICPADEPQKAKSKKNSRKGCVWGVLLLLIVVAFAIYSFYAYFTVVEQNEVEEYSSMAVKPNLEDELGAEWENESKTERPTSNIKEVITVPSEPVKSASSASLSTSTDSVEKVKSMVTENPNPQAIDSVTSTTDSAIFCTVKLTESLQAKPIKEITVADTTIYDMTGTLVVHKLKSGETIIQLAKRYYGEKRLWPYIVKYNNMKDYNNLAIGQTINIPILK